MRQIRSRRGSLAFTLVEILVVSSIMSGMASQGGYRYAINKANEQKGLNNLRQVYLLLYAQSIGEALPKAAFYPKGDPKKDPKSIMQLIPDAIPQLFVSPFAPEGLKKSGLTYAWNDTVNGKDLSRLPRHTWLLIDLAAFIADPEVPKPSKYLILYADGRTVATKTIPGDIAEAVEEAKKRAESKKQ